MNKPEYTAPDETPSADTPEPAEEISHPKHRSVVKSAGIVSIAVMPFPVSRQTMHETRVSYASLLSAADVALNSPISPPPLSN